MIAKIFYEREYNLEWSFSSVWSKKL
jgi:hypothetical protein